MRIITGKFKGRRLEMPIGEDIRPTTEKVKEAIFSAIQADIYGASVADLFTGTGNLGLEAISRGAAKCYFCDNSRESLNLAKRNIAMCRAEEWSVILPGSYERALEKIAEKKEKIDIFFLDPPYNKGLYDNCLKMIRELELLEKNGIILAEHDSKDIFPDTYEGFTKLKDKIYGRIAFTIYY